MSKEVISFKARPEFAEKVRLIAERNGISRGAVLNLALPAGLEILESRRVLEEPAKTGYKVRDKKAVSAAAAKGLEK